MAEKNPPLVFPPEVLEICNPVIHDTSIKVGSPKWKETAKEAERVRKSLLRKKRNPRR